MLSVLIPLIRRRLVSSLGTYCRKGHRATTRSHAQVFSHQGLDASPSCPPSSFAALSIALCCNRSNILGSLAVGLAYDIGSGTPASAPARSGPRFLFVPAGAFCFWGGRSAFGTAGLRGGFLRERCVGCKAAWRYWTMIAFAFEENLIESEPLQSQLSFVLRGVGWR
jgi:hypothetical protein